MSALAGPLRQAGLQALKDGRLQQAVELLLQAAEKDPESFETYSYLGAAYSRLGDYERARKAFGRAIQINVQSPRGWYNLGVAHQMAGDPDAARTCYERALALDPSYAAASEALAKLPPKVVSMSDLASVGGKVRLPGAHAQTLEDQSAEDAAAKPSLTPQDIARLATPDGSFHMPGAQASHIADEEKEGQDTGTE